MIVACVRAQRSLCYARARSRRRALSSPGYAVHHAPRKRRALAPRPRHTSANSPFALDNRGAVRRRLSASARAWLRRSAARQIRNIRVMRQLGMWTPERGLRGIGAGNAALSRVQRKNVLVSQCRSITTSFKLRGSFPMLSISFSSRAATKAFSTATAAKSWWSSATFVASPPLPSRGCCPAEKIGLHWRWDQPGERHHANQTLMVVVVGSCGFCISRAQRRACLTAHDCRE